MSRKRPTLVDETCGIEKKVQMNADMERIGLRVMTENEGWRGSKRRWRRSME